MALTEKYETVTTMAYLLGLRKDQLREIYGARCPDTLEACEQDRDATIVRYLCKLRVQLLRNFRTVDDEMVYNLSNIDRMPDKFDVENIAKLKSWGITIVKCNYRSELYMNDICLLINEFIPKCQHLFCDWIKFDYIKNLFYITNPQNVMKGEFNTYNRNIAYYPFQLYMHWYPSDYSNILYNDAKFLGILYSINKDRLDDLSKVYDADEETKTDIYEFIKEGKKTVIAVDCENSDAFKLCGMLNNLDEDMVSKIEKILLFDDAHTTVAWQKLSSFVKIPVERIVSERVSEYKSLVDLKMTVGICREFYMNNVDSFILCSSDSDFWGLISEIPANFLVAYENQKCGECIKKKFWEHQITNCSIDDFYTGNAGGLKKTVLLETLRQHLPHIVGMNGMELAKMVFEEARITYNQSELKNFHTKYIESLRLKTTADGDFYIEICNS